MLDPVVGIIFHREAHRGLKALADFGDPDAIGACLCDDHVPLSDALSRSWEEDAHMVMYRLEGNLECTEPCWARANKRSPFPAQLLAAGGCIRVPVLVFDHDLPKDEQGRKQQWDEDAIGEFLSALEESALPFPTYWYTTLHGSRFVYVLTEEVDHHRAERLAAGMLASFKDKGIELDSACKDWTRLFRLPRTVRQDTGKAHEPLYELQGDMLDPSSVVEIDVKNSDLHGEMVEYVGSRPEDTEVEEILAENRGAFKKLAKKMLVGRESYNYIFGHTPIDTRRGWNNAVLHFAGQCVAMLAREEGASPESIYALMHESLVQLQILEEEGDNKEDWLRTGWDMVRRMWTAEQVKIAAEFAAHESAVKEGEATREELLANLRNANVVEVPKDPEEAKQWFRQRLIGSDGRNHYVMRPDGTYNLHPVDNAMLVPMIKDLGMEEVVDLYEWRGKNRVPRTPTAILNDHAIPITGIRASAHQRAAWIEGDSGAKVLHTPIYQLNPSLRPIFSKDVATWIELLGGDQHEHLNDWLSHALDFRRAICALNIAGAPNVGKGMLVNGLVECFYGEHLNDGRAFGQFNGGLLKSPIIHCDEGVPKMSSDGTMSIDQAFRAMVSGGNIVVRDLFKAGVTAQTYPRIIFTSNDKDIIREIVGARDLTDDDVRAIEQRLLTIRPGPEASNWIVAHGGYDFTRGWVHGDERSRYIVANHIYWLYMHRTPSKYGSNRFLVEGDIDTTMVRQLRLRSKSALAVMKALVRILSQASPVPGTHITDGRYWVTASGVCGFLERPNTPLDDRISLPAAGKVLRQFATGTSYEDGSPARYLPPGASSRGRFFEVNLELLLECAIQYGIDVAKIEGLLMLQPGGERRIAEARVRGMNT